MRTSKQAGTPGRRCPETLGLCPGCGFLPSCYPSLPGGGRAGSLGDRGGSGPSLCRRLGRHAGATRGVWTGVWGLWPAVWAHVAERWSGPGSLLSSRPRVSR